MIRFLTTFVSVAALLHATGPVHAQSKKIDLRTRAGTESVHGQWRYHDVKITEVAGKNRDGSPNKTYSYEPKAKGPEYDDSGWEVISPETLKNARSNGQICFCWYRIKVTLPPEAEGKSVFFQTTVDDYGEIWVDGKLPRKPGDTGGPIVAGFNYPNRVELKDPKPGKTYQLAIFGINGPISDTPTNWIFLGPTFLEFVDKK
jgi:gluconolactonase